MENNRRFEKVDKLKESEVIIIHYSCQDFIKYDSPTKIFSIIVKFLNGNDIKTFSVKQVSSILNKEISEDNYEELELHMLEEFFQFAEKHQNHVWVHWNMNSSSFGFEAIENRYFKLQNNKKVNENLILNKKLIAQNDKKFDLGKEIRTIYEVQDYEKLKFYNLAKLNAILGKNFLPGADEARAFDAKDYDKLFSSNYENQQLEKEKQKNKKT